MPIVSKFCGTDDGEPQAKRQNKWWWLAHLHGKPRRRVILGPFVAGGVDSDPGLEQQHLLVRRLGQLQQVAAFQSENEPLTRTG
jgi:hypothetical protein